MSENVSTVCALVETHPTLEELCARYPALVACKESIWCAFQTMLESFKAGNKLLICGNGGSASDSDHLAAELLKSFQKKRKLNPLESLQLPDHMLSELEGGLPAIPLTSFQGFLTAFQNDRNGDYAFAQLAWTLGRSGDVLLAISTSGNSKNVLNAIDAAKAKGMQTIALTGMSGGKMLGKADICIRAPEDRVYKIQELHLPIYHALASMLEDVLFVE